VSALDFASYSARIGWNCATAPTYETLAGILAAHMAAIPFENFDVLLGRGVALDLPSLTRKLVEQRRGGYCFEQATLLAAALEALGFELTRHTARVTLVASRRESARTHMFLLVRLGGDEFVVDPGFGALAPRVPVPLAGTHAVAGSDTHWIARDDGYRVLYHRRGDKTTECWVTTLDRDNLVDFEMGNYFTSTNPLSPFRNRVMLRALTSDGRVGVMNRDVTIWRGDCVEMRVLADRAALRRLVAEHFGFDLPQIETMRVPSIPEWG
jgi:N-hydroxyarylamine O-acetyltransferase